MPLLPLPEFIISPGDDALREAAPVQRDNCVVTGARLFVLKSSESISEGHLPSRSRVVNGLLDFRDKTGLDVENETAHWNFLGDPWM